MDWGSAKMRELSLLSDHRGKSQCHADLLGASRRDNAGFHCGRLREHFPHVGPSPSFAGKYFWLQGEIKAVFQLHFQLGWIFSMEYRSDL